MAALSIKTADVVIFQLIRRNLRGKDASQRTWKEVRTFEMAVKPAVITYTEGSRSAITQTSPNAGFIDKFGSRLIQVSMVGTFGIQPRREGIEFKDGFTRLQEFKTELFRTSQLARAQKEDGEGNQYVYAVNFYDFINNERFTINLDTLVRSLDARRNPFEPTYQLNFTALGEPIEEATTSDPVLIVLLAVDKLFDEGNKALSTVLNNSAIRAISGGVELMDALGSSAENIASLITMYTAAIAGQIASLSQGSSTLRLLSDAESEIGRIVGIKG
jgi:hypothetical protein